MADYNINMTPGLEQQRISVSQHDVGREFSIELTDKSRQPYTIPAGATVKLVGMKPSGLGFTVNGTWNQSLVTFTTTAGMTDESGMMLCEVRINKDDTQIGSANAILLVERDPHDDDVTDDTAPHLINTITALVEEANDAADRAEAALGQFTEITVSADTLAAGSQATASYSDGHITFGIPRGDTGATGATGPQGPAYTLTEQDKAAIVADVLTEMDNAETEAM